VRNNGMKKLKNFIQQKNYDTSVKTITVYNRSSNLIVVYCARINEEMIIAETVDILERWAQHFEEVPNPNNVDLENHMHPSETFEEMELDIDEMDVELAIKELKNYKALGPDGLPAEVFKYSGDILNKYL
jgi:hypothetical protein